MRRTGGTLPRGFVAVPLILSSALIYPPNLRAFLQSGLGGGALGVSLIAMAGAHAGAGRGSRRTRTAAGVLAAAGIVGLAITPFSINPDLMVTSLSGTGTAVQGAGLVTLLAAATTAVVRQPPRVG